MAAPFCTACGAAVAEGTRFCVKCGQPVGGQPGSSRAAPPPLAPTEAFTTPEVPAPPPPPPAAGPTVAWTPPPPPPAAPPVFRPVPQAVTQKEGPGAGLWIGIFGILLLLGGAGLWFYTTQWKKAHEDSSVQVAAAPAPSIPVQPTPAQPTPIPTPEGSTLVPAPTPNPTTEVIPPNPDQAQKEAAPTQAPRQPVAQTRPQPVAGAPADPPPARQPEKAARQTSGVLHATVEVAQNGEVVFENLPGARLKFTFDHSLWQPTISHQANGTQTLVMRSLKPGIQTTCDVRWEIVQ